MPAERPPSVRHDLLNHLNAIMGYALLLVEDLPEGPERDFARRIRQAAGEALTLADGLPRERGRTCPRLLLVDPAGDALAATLEQRGWEVTPAATAAEAAAALKAAPGAWQVVLAAPRQARSAALAKVLGDTPLAERCEGEAEDALAARLTELLSRKG